jgi:ABC transport system ATP-binding/permease protein
MNPCPSCDPPNAADNNFCQRCGRPLQAAAGQGEKTIMASGPLVRAIAPRAEPRRTRPVAEVFAGKTRLGIGRGNDCDIVLPHPTVSRKHAELERRSTGELVLHDAGSSNGVSVNGRRLTEPHTVHDGERIGIGPFLFSLEKGVIYYFDSSASLRLQARALEKVVYKDGGVPLKLLDDINLTVEPGEFVSLLGPSGSGKSTLMDCLNGRRRATAGNVLANGEDFYRFFDNFRQSLGYVPQKDIVHWQLTVGGALDYTAQLRLPIDTTPAERHNRIEEVLRQMELTDFRRNPVFTLSGGQLKRLCLGAELLARPAMLYIDEATSGLDAGTDAKMMRLFRDLADREGKSVVCITHNVENVDDCHLILVLRKGCLVYYGPPDEARRYFDVQKISGIYDRLEEKDKSSAWWLKKFRDSEFHEKYVSKRQAPPPPSGLQVAPGAATIINGIAANEQDTQPAAPPPSSVLLPPGHSSIVVPPPQRSVPRPHRPPVWHQFRVLLARYLELIFRDGRSLQMLAWQAPVIGLLILVGFMGMSFTDKIPATKRLDDEQKAALEAFQQKLNDVGAGKEIDPEILEELRRIHVATSHSGKPVSGADMARLLQELHRQEVFQEMANAKVPILPVGEINSPRSTYMLLSILAIIVFWLGCNNASKEIVKEEAIYSRERAVNLGIFPYLGSKFLVLSVISALQVLLLMVVVYGGLHLVHGTLQPLLPAEYCLGAACVYLAQFGVLVLLAMTGVAAGLLLSAMVSSTDRASVLLPYVLIPQIILGGGMIPVHDSGPLMLLSMIISPVYWAFRAIHLGAKNLPEGFPQRVPYDDSVLWPCLALTLQLILLLAGTVWCLRRKDLGEGDWLTLVWRRLARLIPRRRKVRPA